MLKIKGIVDQNRMQTKQTRMGERLRRERSHIYPYLQSPDNDRRSPHI